ncbi:prepilin peptidase [Singulisphaera acidiphila]|uniref:Prepilin signal peptidase PulO-like peptidase n=1 Tax=Singulisphaera acidiphila (strain ATCC BAA-1392 / DSM 18658 / VKM B-2454 / MOB10) TaxID=886293 RepID=L0DPG4_SINAD|nr:prepilin peptidase [Singulisphaera acidiphila]AGA30571.1 prepilin signal peptidase PulO-like peptidase [Singulisphaera acidiphila DSM 18658]
MNWNQHALVCLFLAIFGAAVGSFVNVCVYRIPKGLSLFRPRSRCPLCRQPVALRDNVPILGWLLLRGRCRSCRMPISVRYPLVEALVAMILPVLYLLESSCSVTDPLEGGLAAFVVRLFGRFLLATSFFTAVLIGLDRRARVCQPQAEVTGHGDV